MNAVTPFEQAAIPRRAAGQGTMVEQSRAIAEVQAAVVMARQNPRDLQSALADMRQSCAMPFLAERAFFRFPRGGQTVSGKSVHLARELARCWGNIVYGIKELRRDDDAAESEMLAYAWDIQTNTRNETVFIVPHKRDKRGGAETLTDMRDIYENNANNGARRLRECILASMPPWFVEEAAEICSRTLKDGGGKPLPIRIADCLSVYKEIGVTKAQLERKVGRPSDDWLPEDVAQLGVVFKSIRRGEISKDEEFPREELPTHKKVDEQADGFEKAGAGKAKAAAPAPAAQAEGQSQIAGEASAPTEVEPQHDWKRDLPALIEAARACADIAALTAFKTERAGTIKAMPDDVFADWSDFIDGRVAELKGGAK